MKILLLTIVVALQSAAVGWAQCFTCTLGPGGGLGGHCITCKTENEAGYLGYQACQSAATPDDACRLSGPACDVPWCQGGGGGGGTCEDPDICPIEMEAVAIDASDEHIAAVFGPTSRTRVIPGAGGQFGAKRALEAVRALAPGSAGRLALVGRHYTVGSGPLENGFGADDGSGYLIRAEAAAGGVHVRVHDRGWAKRGQSAADVQVAPNDVLLVRVWVAGRDRILAMAPRALGVGEDKTSMVSRQEALKDMPIDVVERLPLRLLDHTEFHLLAPTRWGDMKQLYR